MSVAIFLLPGWMTDGICRNFPSLEGLYDLEWIWTESSPQELVNYVDIIKLYHKHCIAILGYTWHSLDQDPCSWGQGRTIRRLREGNSGWRSLKTVDICLPTYEWCNWFSENGVPKIVETYETLNSTIWIHRMPLTLRQFSWVPATTARTLVWWRHEMMWHRWQGCTSLIHFTWALAVHGIFLFSLGVHSGNPTWQWTIHHSWMISHCHVWFRKSSTDLQGSLSCHCSTCQKRQPAFQVPRQATVPRCNMVDGDKAWHF